MDSDLMIDEFATNDLHAPCSLSYAVQPSGVALQKR
jgi:hypothetical protein